MTDLQTAEPEAPNTTVNTALPRLRALDDILDAVCEQYQLEFAHILSKRKTKTIAEARVLVCLVARRCTRLSFPEIGLVIRRDHTTVMSAVHSAEQRMTRDPYFAAVARALIERFGAVTETFTQ
jgi:chromosomal replication initiation ATPase DnaA